MRNFPRPPTEAELGLIEWLLTEAAVVPDVTRFLAQTTELEIIGCCKCGCPSVEFIADAQAKGATMVADAQGKSPEGVAIGILLWQREGRLASLEVYGYETHPYSLPRPEDLSPAFPAVG